MDKVYQFIASTGGGTSKLRYVSEKDLLPEDEDLLLGQLIKNFEEFPASVKSRFIMHYIEEYLKNKMEK